MSPEDLTSLRWKTSCIIKLAEWWRHACLFSQAESPQSAFKLVNHKFVSCSTKLPSGAFHKKKKKKSTSEVLFSSWPAAIVTGTSSLFSCLDTFMLWSLLALWDGVRSWAACWSHRLSQIVGPLLSAGPDRSYDSGSEPSVVVCGLKHCPAIFAVPIRILGSSS